MLSVYCYNQLQFCAWVGLSSMIILSMRRKQLLINKSLYKMGLNHLHFFVPEIFLWRLACTYENLIAILHETTLLTASS